MPESSGDMTAAFSAALSGASSAAEASPASTPAPESAPAANTPAAATAQPAATTQTPVGATTPAPDANQPAPAGEPPKWRWQDILENARKTSAQEAETRLRQEYESKLRAAEPFQQISEQERHGLVIWHRALSGDANARALVAQADQRLATSLGWVHGASSADDVEPEADLVTADGTPVYSAMKQREWREWNNRQIERRFAEKLQPLERVAQTLQERETQAVADRTVGQILIEYRKDPDFVKHEPAIKRAIFSDPKLVMLARENPEAAIDRAFFKVFRKEILPARDQQSDARVLANLQQRAVAAQGNPNAPVASTPKKFQPGTQGFQEALHHFAATGS